MAPLARMSRPMLSQVFEIEIMSVKRIRLRHDKKQLYFQLPDAWVDDATEGLSFTGSVQA